jgi:VWFA-related protein
MTFAPTRRPAGPTVLLAALGLLAAIPARPEATAPGTFTSTEEVRIVEVPVQVTRDGKPVLGLTAADFEVWAGKEKQRIVGFEVVDAAVATVASSAAGPGPTAATATTPPPIAGRRHFLFLFDLSFADPRSLARAQEAARKIARRDLQRSDLAAVGIFSPLRGPRLVLGFTSDRDQLELALSTLGSTELIEHQPDFVGLMLGPIEAKVESVSEQSKPSRAGPGGEEADLPNARLDIATKVLNDTRTLESMQQRDLDASQRDRVRRFTAGLSDLAKLMQQVQGRKQVILLSRGFDSMLFSGEQGTAPREITSGEEEMREIVRTDSDRRWGNTRLQNELRRSLDEMRRADCVIHSIDISGAEVEIRGVEGEAYEVKDTAPSSGRGSDSLFVMAQQTGGSFHKNFNDLGDALRQVLDLTSVTYVLSVQPVAAQAKDGYVPLRVEVRGASRAQVTSRPGYFVGLPPAAQQGLQERLRMGEMVLSGREGGQIREAVAGVPLSGGACAVVEVEGASLLTGHVGDMASADVTVYAFDEKGTIRGVARQLVGLDLNVVGERLRATGFKLFAYLELAPGHYDLRALVRNTVSGRYGVAVGTIDVPAEPISSAVAGVFVEPPERDWLLVRADSERPLAYPFTLAGRTLVPAVAPHLRSGQSASLWLAAPAGDLQAVVKRADGAVAGNGELALGERVPVDGGERLLATFTTAGLAPGAYRLEVTSPAAGHPSTSVAFTVD